MFTQPSPHPKLNTPLWPIVGTTHSLTDHVSGLSSPPGVSTWREPGPQPEPVWQLCNWLPSDETVSAALPGLSHQLPAPPAPRFWAWRMVCVHQEYDLIPLMPKRGALSDAEGRREVQCADVFQLRVLTDLWGPHKWSNYTVFVRQWGFRKTSGVPLEKVSAPSVVTKMGIDFPWTGRPGGTGSFALRHLYHTVGKSWHQNSP